MRKVHLVAFPGTDVLMHFGREVSAHELDQYEHDIKYLEEFQYSLELRPLVEANGREALEVLTSISQAPFDSMRTSQARRGATSEANRVIVNFLSSMRLLLDHIQTRITRHFGSSSDMLSKYREVTARVHDNSRAYRVLYNLRNYVQHCGMPVREITVEDSESKGRRVAVECNTEELLTRFSDWRFAKKDLEDLQPSFAIAPMIEKVLSNLREILDNLREAEMSEVRLAAERVMKLIVEAAGPHPQGAVVEILTLAATNQTQFRLHVPPERLMQELGFHAHRAQWG